MGRTSQFGKGLTYVEEKRKGEKQLRKNCTEQTVA